MRRQTTLGKTRPASLHTSLTEIIREGCNTVAAPHGDGGAMVQLLVSPGCIGTSASGADRRLLTTAPLLDAIPIDPRACMVSQLPRTAIGCVVCPLPNDRLIGSSSFLRILFSGASGERESGINTANEPDPTCSLEKERTLDSGFV